MNSNPRSLFVSPDLSELLFNFVRANYKTNPFILANRFIFPVRNQPHLSLSLSLKSTLLFFPKLLFHLSKSLFFTSELQLYSSKKCSCLFVSNLINSNNHIYESDLYYNKLPFILSRSSPVVITYFSPAQSSFKNLIASNSSDNIYRHLVSKSFSFRTFCRAAIPSLLTFISLFVLSFLAKKLTSKLYLLIAAFQSFSPSYFSNLQSINDIVEYARSYHVDRIIYTFEGHAWEKLLNHTVKHALPSVKLIAYNHTVIFADSDTLTRTYSDDLDPDAIFTVGSSTADQFKNIYPSSMPISCIGSQKANDRSFPSTLPSTNHSILFLPEGFLSEVFHHIRLAESIAPYFPDRSFVVRLHPCLIKHTKLIDSYIDSLSLPNLSLSSQSFHQDIITSSFAVYTGSSAILESMFYNLYPVYYPHPRGFNLNPLHSLQPCPYPLVASDVHDFERLFKISPSLPPPSLYASLLLSPFNLKAALSLLV